jgi:hypothetical protein
MERKFEFISVGTDAASTVTPYFLTPEAMRDVADRVKALEKPGGLVTVFDTASGTLVVCSVRVADDGQFITGWSLTGPMSKDEAFIQAREAMGHAEGQTTETVWQ